MTNARDAAENKILDDYISEPAHDLATLERYLALYPDAADALHNLHFAMHTRGVAAAQLEGAEDEPWLDSAVARVQARLGAAPLDPFESKSPEQLAAVRQRLGIRAATFKGFCDRFVDVSTVPRHVLRELAHDLDRSLIELLAFLVQPPRMAASQSFRADGRPGAPAAKISFAQLLEQSNETEEVRRRLLEERD
jgi:hypothetical protein